MEERLKKTYMERVYGKYFLKAVKLSLSSSCGAHCIFCPENRGERIKTKTMDIQLVDKIVREISSDQKLHTVTRFSCGENGDAFLNPDALECLRIIKRRLPKCTVFMATNFQNLTRDKATTILKEGLIDSVCCNIDGHDDYYYRVVKRMSLERVEQNLMDFLEIRKEMHSKVPLTIFAITYRKYVNEIKNNFGFLPCNLHGKELKDLVDDFKLIEAKWKPMLDPVRDRIMRQPIYGWAERGLVDPTQIKYKKYNCPLLENVKREAHIAPDGTWYICCHDANNELILGNLANDSLVNLMMSARRMKLIRMLEKKQFSKIGGPCKTVNCCRPFYKPQKRLSRGRILSKLPFSNFTRRIAYEFAQRML